MDKKIKNQIRKEIFKIDEIKEEVDFYNEDQLLKVLKFVLGQYQTLLKSNLELIKKVNKKGVINGKL